MKTDGFTEYVCDKCAKTAYLAATDTGTREWFEVRRYSAGQATRIASDVQSDVFVFCSDCNASFLQFAKQSDVSFNEWLKEGVAE